MSFSVGGQIYMIGECRTLHASFSEAMHGASTGLSMA